MARLFDYLTWRGDLTLAQTPFCEVDALVLSRLAYLPFDGAVSESFTEEIPLREAAKLLLAQEDFSSRVLVAQDIRLLTELAKSARFGDILLSGSESILDLETQTQFAALTINLGNMRCFAFRGTDNTFVGWKEDFNMTFTYPIPSQLRAAEYLQRGMAETQGEAIVCGHSKGGNLAVYAAALCPEPERITAIYNHDGPGFDDRLFSTAGYQAIRTKIHTYVPQSSIVGLLLEHVDGYTIIRSENEGLMQHDLYSWQVLATRFVTLDTVTNGSRFLDSTLRTWLTELEPTEREAVVDTIYEMLLRSNINSAPELWEKKYQSIRSLLRARKGIDEEARKNLMHALRLLVKSMRSSLPAFYHNGQLPDQTK